MPTMTKPLPFGYVPPPFPVPDVELIADDGIPMENDWHNWLRNVLVKSLRAHYQGRQDFYCGGNNFIYFSEQQARKRDFLGPDFYFVWGRPPLPPRPWWAIWNEDWRFPNVIVEFLSPSTRTNDLGFKKDVYQDIFQTPDYYCYDSDAQELIGWTLAAGEYVELQPNERGWLWSEQLNLWIGKVRGTTEGVDEVWLRFLTPEGKIVATYDERAEANLEKAELRAAKAQRRAAEAKRLASDAERRAADSERHASEVERRAADSERLASEAKRRADDSERQRLQLEAELAQLKAALGQRDKPAS